jgi:hypothetical protein
MRGQVEILASTSSAVSCVWYAFAVLILAVAVGVIAVALRVAKDGRIRKAGLGWKFEREGSKVSMKVHLGVQSDPLKEQVQASDTGSSARTRQGLYAALVAFLRLVFGAFF